MSYVVCRHGGMERKCETCEAWAELAAEKAAHARSKAAVDSWMVLHDEEVDRADKAEEARDEARGYAEAKAEQVERLCGEWEHWEGGHKRERMPWEPKR